MKRTGKSMLEIIVKRFADECRASDFYFRSSNQGKTEGINKNCWISHREAYWTCKEMLQAYGFSIQELNTMEHEALYGEQERA